jgi:hypothetical protein
MTINSQPSRSRMGFWIGIVLFFLFVLPPPPARAVESRQPAPVYAAMVSQPLPAKGWTWTHIRSALGTRRRMMQFATIGMCIGLYILMRK